MPRKGLRTEEKLERLRECVELGSEAQALDCLRDALTERSNFLVAKAAKFAGEKLAYELIPELRAAFERFTGDDAQEADKTCAAKRAIARALYELDFDDAAFYRRFLDYRQPEPAFGSSLDSAVELRCICALGLVASGDPNAVLELLPLLNDAEWQARVGSLKALELVNPVHAQIVIRQKIFQGDEEPEVIAQCFSSLLKAAGEDALPFTLEWLSGGDRARQEAAALALGESRLEAALQPLIEVCDSLSPLDPRTRLLFQALALQRRERATQYLLETIANAPAFRAVRAAEALSIYSYNEQLRDQVNAIAAERKLKSLDDVIAAHWQE
ncbi:hypothetical protein H0Z60_14595 [Ectothiorhodospiraceae bacterium WFHF3C12]|nr:hypothetical protein [Ectothiorhodospiraceae bacterium WFHF3C12]